MTSDSIDLRQMVSNQRKKLINLKAEKDAISSEKIFDFNAIQKVDNEIISLSIAIKSYEKLLETSGSGKETIDDLEEKAYAGDTEAIDTLISLSKTNPQYADVAKSILSEIAEKGDMTMAKMLLDSCSKDGQLLSAVMKGNSCYSQTAAELLADGGLKKDINGKTFDIQADPKVQKLIISKLAEDPERNVSRLAMFSNTFEGIAALSNIAVTKPTTYAGKLAARALAKSFAKGNNKISAAALDSLKKAGCAGNTEAVKSLGSLVRSNVLSNNRAMQAIDALTDIARSSNQAGSEGALGEIVGIAKDKKVSPRLRSHAIENMGKLIEEGHDNNFTATDALIDIARSKTSGSVTQKAVNTLFKACDKKPEVLDRAVPLIYDVAKGSVPADKKTKMFAVDLLEKASGQGGGNSGVAKQSLVSLIKNHNQAVAMRAGDSVQRQNINPQEYNVDTQKPQLPVNSENPEKIQQPKNDFNMIS